MLLQSIFYRPAIHFSPLVNFMNDPNGLIYDDATSTYHMYYQYNPTQNVAGDQHWGHTTSKDLLHWEDQPYIDVQPNVKNHFMFSGTVVNDMNNTSGLFPSKNDTNFVGIYTDDIEYNNGTNLQEQSIMYSLDGGQTYEYYKNNPVLNLNSGSFRDPQVMWLAEHEKWLMTVAHARDHWVEFYESDNLLEWTYLSKFRAGITGVDYECPNLVPVKDEDNDVMKYVLFLSINPGMPLGGSGTQYFIGNFNGTHFVPDDEDTRIVDFAKDNYALQYINPGTNAALDDTPQAAYIGWFSNWQYSQEAPTGDWRSAMTLARYLSIKKDWYNVTRITQTPVDLSKIRIENATVTNTVKLDGSKYVNAIKLPDVSTAFELVVEGDVKSETARFTLEFTNFNGEVLEIGLDINSQSPQVWINRDKLHGFEHPFFSSDFSSLTSIEDNKFKWNIIFDASLLEFYADNGFTVGSVLYFPESPLTYLTFSSRDDTDITLNTTIYPLEKTMDRETYH